MAKGKKSLTPEEAVQAFRDAKLSAKAPIVKGFEGVRFQSAKYGCYDKGMPPHPSWEVPDTFMTSKGMTAVHNVYYIGSRKNVPILTAQYHPFPNFFLPEEATFFTDESSSAKLSKNERASIVLYLSPVQRNSFAFQTCNMASVGCEMACLDYSGQKVGQEKQRLAIARTDYYFAHKESFMQRVLAEIMAKDEKVNKNKPISQRSEIAVRLNGTSDLPLFNEFATWCVKNRVRMPKNIVFYDYTKNPYDATTTRESEYDNPFMKIQPDQPVRHKVTFSLSETNYDKYSSRQNALEVMKAGGLVAGVFLTPPKGIPMYKEQVVNGKTTMVKVPRPHVVDTNGNKVPYVAIKDKWYAPLPEVFEMIGKDGKKYTFPIYDGDSSDDLMLDLPSGKGGMLGLRAKLRAQHDTTGFAMPSMALVNPKDKKAMAYLKSIEYDLNQNYPIIKTACKASNKPIKPQMFTCSDTQIKEGSVVDVW